ncbi:MAG: anti-sigma factor antagonist [Bacteroidetes bacterium]|nr:MAG: anti-sigma factor antagonist [Bacteroidota bacterium]MBL1144397.1 anti-sigma factor antagonist [Bacteroidota bacterium]MCB0801713.1 STAS domain-containing protein [Flavobacteriales bacterium]NOG57193.1 STAS domain-containing protein [Bacteroidota bacterium]
MNQESFKIEQQEKFTLITIKEDKFTAKFSPDLKAELVILNSIGTKYIIIDLALSSYCDSSGLSAILVANRICKDNDGLLVICNLKPAVAKLIDISQLNSVLNITPTLNEAIDFIFMDELEKSLGDLDENLN